MGRAFASQAHPRQRALGATRKTRRSKSADAGFSAGAIIKKSQTAAAPQGGMRCSSLMSFKHEQRFGFSGENGGHIAAEQQQPTSVTTNNSEYIY
jgi:hypothetical protein